eukprot:3329144-Lingulodinium_polyedra.AAC.1
MASEAALRNSPGEASDAANAARLLERLSLCEPGTRCLLPSPDSAVEAACHSGRTEDIAMASIEELAPAGDGSD